MQTQTLTRPNDPSGVTAFTFRTDNAYFVLDTGKGTWDGGARLWEPPGMENINNLLISVENGTSSEGKKCEQQRHVFNWSRMAYKKAVDMDNWAKDNNGVKSRFYSQWVPRSDLKVGATRCGYTPWTTSTTT